MAQILARIASCGSDERVRLEDENWLRPIDWLMRDEETRCFFRLTEQGDGTFVLASLALSLNDLADIASGDFDGVLDQERSS